MKIYCCEEHVELAIDIIVDEQETFPQLTQMEEEQDLSTACEYCRNTAIYVVANN